MDAGEIQTKGFCVIGICETVKSHVLAVTDKAYPHIFAGGERENLLGHIIIAEVDLGLAKQYLADVKAILADAG